MEATEWTYVAELAKVISEVGRELGFYAEAEKETEVGRPDLVIYYNDRPVCVVEVKRPEVPLSDPELNRQALRYAEYLRAKLGVNLYAVHNMRYLKLFKHTIRQPALPDFFDEGGVQQWAPVSDFPLKIMPWVSSLQEYRQISINNEARKNVERFLLSLKEILEGKTLDLSHEVIETVGKLIEDGAGNRALAELEGLYRSDEEVRKIVEAWRGERGIEKPKDDSELRKQLQLLLKERLYTFSMKALFYLLLQSIDAEMAGRLKETVKLLEEVRDAETFRRMTGILFEYAIKRTGDFEEIFSSNTVDRLPFVQGSLPYLQRIVHYLNQVRWGEVNVDVIGRIFEGLIYKERRHLLGQHFTDTKVADLILTGVFLKGGEPDYLLDPACGSGTFLVRAINYWRVFHRAHKRRIYDLVEGVDIDRLASMLAKINLYIQALERIRADEAYVPRIHHRDFFKLELEPKCRYIVANPPYTRQEEMAMAFYDRDYKRLLQRAVSDISGWSERASIYAYFLVRAGKLLREGGRLGFIVENSWLNAEYGRALKRWLFNNFRVEYVIESLVERWFRDAAINTNIIIAERGRGDVARFIFLKKRLQELIGDPPPSSDLTANERYYERNKSLYSEADACEPDRAYQVCESERMRVTSLRRDFLLRLEERLGRLGIVRGPKEYLDIVFGYIDGAEERIAKLGEVLEIRCGLKTNANELFYLPSKYWTYAGEDDKYLSLVYGKREKGGVRRLRLSKRYLRRLIRPDHLENAKYGITDLPLLKKEDYVVWVEDEGRVDDPGMREYIKWAKKVVEEGYKTEGRYPTLYKELKDPQWLKLPDTSGGLLLFRSAVFKNYSIWLNRVAGAQIDARLYAGYVRSEYRGVQPETLFAVVNSVFTYIGMELLGRTNLGLGALDIKIADYEIIPIVNPMWLESQLRRSGKFQGFLEAVKRLLELKPADIETEASRSARLEVEKYVLGSLGLSEDTVRKLYQELIRLVALRTERARSA